jgi:hypothetical protein
LSPAKTPKKISQKDSGKRYHYPAFDKSGVVCHSGTMEQFLYLGHWISDPKAVDAASGGGLRCASVFLVFPRADADC